jgi:hypothetical protein
LKVVSFGKTKVLEKSSKVVGWWLQGETATLAATLGDFISMLEPPQAQGIETPPAKLFTRAGTVY